VYEAPELLAHLLSVGLNAAEVVAADEKEEVEEDGDFADLDFVEARRKIVEALAAAEKRSKVGGIRSRLYLRFQCVACAFSMSNWRGLGTPDHCRSLRTYP
jgi:hypothetical protein